MERVEAAETTAAKAAVLIGWDTGLPADAIDSLDLQEVHDAGHVVHDGQLFALSALTKLGIAAAVHLAARSILQTEILDTLDQGPFRLELRDHGGDRCLERKDLTLREALALTEGWDVPSDCEWAITFLRANEEGGAV